MEKREKRSGLQKGKGKMKAVKTKKEPRGKVYISGPISGHPLKERQGYFQYHANRLRLHGYEPVNPMEGVDIANPPLRADVMRKDIRQLRGCRYILLLPGHEKSRGCAVEKAVAEACGIKVLELLFNGGYQEWE